MNGEFPSAQGEPVLALLYHENNKLFLNMPEIRDEELYERLVKVTSEIRD